jgi:D-threo-aldose 1-dehydrogenase
MRMNRLGRVDLELSELGFGAASIGNLYAAVDDETAAAAVAAAWDGGVRYFDTAPHYGLGLSERRLGATLTDRPREEFVVSTKVGRLLVPNPAPTGSDLAGNFFDVPDDLTREQDFSRDGVLRSLEGSLSRLGLDRVDILYVHDPDQHMDVAIGEAVPALVELREQGVVRAIGVGTNTVDPLRRFVEATDIDIVMVAHRWTLLDRSARGLLDDCARHGVSVVAAAPFNSGLLAARWPTEDARFFYEPAGAELLARSRRMASICEAHGTRLPHAAIRFPLREPMIASVVTGMRTAEESRTNVEAIDVAVSAALWAELDAVIPQA